MVQMGSKLEDEQSLIIQLQKKIKEVQVVIVHYLTKVPNSWMPVETLERVA